MFKSWRFLDVLPNLVDCFLSSPRTGQVETPNGPVRSEKTKGSSRTQNFIQTYLRNVDIIGITTF